MTSQTTQIRFFTFLAFLALCISLSAAEITITVTVPPSTPDNSIICVTGNHEFLSNWQGKGIQMREAGPNLYRLTHDFAAGTNLEFKFTRGCFDTVEKSSQGMEIPNRKLTVKPYDQMPYHFKVESWADQFSNSGSNNKPHITGNYEIFPDFTSQFLKPARKIIVWLPPSYNKRESARKRYPVLYMHDGRNLFDPTTSFGGSDWGVDEAMTEGIADRRIQEAIVVAIDNTMDRMSEYTPFPDPKHKGGNGENYAKFIVEELKPFIDKKFRTLKDRENTFVGGSSLGGLISLYIGISKRETFSGIIAMSPSIWWSEGGIVNWLIKNDIASWNGKIWVDMGTREGEEAIRFTRLLAEKLKKDAPSFKGLNYKEFSGGTHSESAWRQRMHLPLKYILPYR